MRDLQLIKLYLNHYSKVLQQYGFRRTPPQTDTPTLPIVFPYILKRLKCVFTDVALGKDFLRRSAFPSRSATHFFTPFQSKIFVRSLGLFSSRNLWPLFHSAAGPTLSFFLAVSLVGMKCLFSMFSHRYLERDLVVFQRLGHSGQFSHTTQFYCLIWSRLCKPFILRQILPFNLHYHICNIILPKTLSTIEFHWSARFHTNLDAIEFLFLYCYIFNNIFWFH